MTGRREVVSYHASLSISLLTLEEHGVSSAAFGIGAFLVDMGQLRNW